MKDATKECLNGLAAEVYDEGIKKVIARYDKGLNVSGDYVEKKLRVCSSNNNNNTINKITKLVEYVDRKEDPLIQVVRTHQHNTVQQCDRRLDA